MRASLFLNKILGFVNVAIVRRDSLNSLEHVRAIETRIISKIDDRYKDLLGKQIAQKWGLIDHLSNVYSSDYEERRKCPLCGMEEEHSKFSELVSHCIFGGGRLVRHACCHCGVVFGPDKMFRMSPEELSQEYELHYEVHQEGDSTDQELKAFYALKPSKDGIYLNYGAGSWSRSIEILRNEGWNIWAFEPHGSAAAGSDFVITSPDQLQRQKFDGVFSNNVLEHFRYPDIEIKKLSKLLKPNGRMAHATPCFEYLYEYTRFHLFFFCGKSREILFEKSGVREIEFIRDGEFMCSVLEVKK